MGDEINDIMFADYNEVPWEDLAFNSIKVLLEKFFEVGDKKAGDLFFNLSSVD